MNGLIIDLILVLLLLLIAVIGFYKGFLRELVSFGGFVGSIIISYFAYKPFSAFLDSIFHWGTKVSNFIMEQVAAISPSFGTESGQTIDELRNIIDASNAGLYKQVLNQVIGKATPTVAEPLTVASAVGGIVSGFVMMIISFIVLFLVLRIVVFILDKILKAIPRKSTIGVINKWLGLGLGVVKGFAIVGGVLVLAYFLCMLPGVNDFMLPYIESTYVTKHIYKFLGELAVKFI